MPPEAAIAGLFLSAILVLWAYVMEVESQQSYTDKESHKDEA